jgi:hypothetical protein
MQNKKEIDHWPETLQASKTFLQTKPWQEIPDHHIFVIIDPETDVHLFCSVLGNGKELYGLAVYIGMEGFFSLMDTLSGHGDNFETVQGQRSLLVTFEDRGDLEKEEYELIKRYDIPFRGKQSWPSFVSFKPGYVPWMMDNEEARILSLALQQTVALYEEIKQGLQLPFTPDEEKVLIRKWRENKFVNEVMEIEEILTGLPEMDMTFSEIDVKRLTKIKRRIPVTIELMCTAVNAPVMTPGTDRPIFPTILFAVDHENGEVMYQNIFQEPLNDKTVQHAVLDMIQKLESMPHTIAITPNLYHFLLPVIHLMKTEIVVWEELPLAEELLEDLHAFLAEKE